MIDNTIKKMDVKEFRELGLIQEINRKILHPIGMALEVTIDENGEESLTGVWDYRDDKEGIIYDLKNSDRKRIEEFITKRNKVYDMTDRKKIHRYEKYGFVVEPIPLNDKESI